ncbi:MAG TPA: AvaI/BsoBI family type II restriction endonuclease [Pyrinomonadaceae bacterium]|nr:AvaI/BsoBI family type II restriction endonuclease [Pyrinomonadaceae bacterium]
MAKGIKQRPLSVDDLLTPREETRAGFVKMALEKNSMATVYVEEARALKVIASSAKKPRELLTMKDIRPGLLAASGLSDKALRHLDEASKNDAILGLIESFLEPAGLDFPDELVYRYLLNKGDALGGRARNLAGALGDRKFLQTLVSVLTIAGVKYTWKDRKTGKWVSEPVGEISTERPITAIYWRKGGRDRLLRMNVSVPLIRKNVDLVLLDAKPADLSASGRNLLLQNTRYIALGELKGGIDPAGADEHWKTADTALSRARTHFQGQRLNPPTFFVGAAIERSMAEEIVDQLRRGVMEQAANLTSSEQLTIVCRWLMNL